MDPAYNRIFYDLPMLCELAEGLLLWRLSHQHAIKHYPYLSAYVGYDLVRTPCLLATAHFGWRDFPLVYGITNVPALFLQFFILWEVARSLFRPNSSIRRVAWRLFMVAQVLIIPSVILLSLSQASLVSFPARCIAAGFEQYLCMSQALLLFLVTFVARYYGISFGKNMRGVIFSLGPYLLVNSACFATYQIFGALRPYLELLPAIAYTGMIVIWVYYLWNYVPSDDMAAFHASHGISKQQWSSLWEMTINFVRYRSS